MVWLGVSVFVLFMVLGGEITSITPKLPLVSCLASLALIYVLVYGRNQTIQRKASLKEGLKDEQIS